MAITAKDRELARDQARYVTQQLEDLAARAREAERSRLIAIAVKYASSNTASPDWRQCAAAIIADMREETK